MIGVTDSKKLMEDIPNKIVNYLGIVADVNLMQSDEGKDYIEIVVEPSNIPIAYHGQYHFRSGSTKQELKGVALQQFILKKMGISWDDIVQPFASIDAIDPAAVDYLQRSAISHGRMMESDYSLDVKAVLESLDLIDEEGYLRNAALLLFGKRPSRYFTLCDFRIGRFIKDETDLILSRCDRGRAFFVWQTKSLKCCVPSILPPPFITKDSDDSSHWKYRRKLCVKPSSMPLFIRIIVVCIFR